MFKLVDRSGQTIENDYSSVIKLTLDKGQSIGLSSKKVEKGVALFTGL